MLPVGAFAFSGGLESAIQKGVVTDAATLLAFARTAVEQAARGDGIARDLRASRRVQPATSTSWSGSTSACYARKLYERDPHDVRAHGPEVRRAGVAGDRRRRCCADWRERIRQAAHRLLSRSPWPPISRRWGWRRATAFAVHQYGVAAMMLGAALRLMKISHVDTQRMLYRLNADVAAAYETAAAAGLSDMAGFAPLTEILAAVHVKAHVRLFMN